MTEALSLSEGGLILAEACRFLSVVSQAVLGDPDWHASVLGSASVMYSAHDLCRHLLWQYLPDLEQCGKSLMGTVGFDV